MSSEQRSPFVQEARALRAVAASQPTRLEQAVAEEAAAPEVADPWGMGAPPSGEFPMSPYALRDKMAAKGAFASYSAAWARRFKAPLPADASFPETVPGRPVCLCRQCSGALDISLPEAIGAMHRTMSLALRHVAHRGARHNLPLLEFHAGHTRQYVVVAHHLLKEPLVDATVCQLHPEVLASPGEELEFPFT